MPVATAVDTSILWRRFKDQGDENARTKLIEHYAWMAKVGADKIHVPPTAPFSRDDLYGYAVLGLVDAIDKFDPSRGRPFEAYAPLRVRGAVADALRQTDWLPRGMRQNETRLRECMARLEIREGRAPTDEEICRELGISEGDLEELYQALNASAVQSLEDLVSEIGDLHSGCAIADNSSTSPELSAQNTQVRKLLKDAIDELADKEKTVIALYYYEDMTLKEIGKVLGLTESRICQIHTRAILRLQSRLARWLDVMFLAA